MSKQDRQGARTPADLERRYNFGQRFAELMGIAGDARDVAAAAQQAFDGLDQEEIFNRLTNNGQAQGIYRDENGDIYINASYLASGVIASEDGSVRIDLGNNLVTIDTLIEGRQGKMELSANGIDGFGWDSERERFLKTLRITPGFKTVDGSWMYTMITSAESEAGLAVSSGVINTPTYLGHALGETRIRGTTIMVGGKTVSWKDNGDGTFTLIGQ